MVRSLFLASFFFLAFSSLNTFANDCLERPAEFVEKNSSDYDGDGILNAEDNCLFVANKDQLDSNGDRVGDACDTDLDSIPNHCDNCEDIANADQSDLNENNIGDLCEPEGLAKQEADGTKKKGGLFGNLKGIFKKKDKVEQTAVLEAPTNTKAEKIKVKKIDETQPQDDFSEFESEEDSFGVEE